MVKACVLTASSSHVRMCARMLVYIYIYIYIYIYMRTRVSGCRSHKCNDAQGSDNDGALMSPGWIDDDCLIICIILLIDLLLAVYYIML